MTDAFGEAFWDERYRSKPALWSGRPNPQLVEAASGLEPGRALDVGSGEGADVIWLAERGWQVTGVDFSRVALERAAAQAARMGPEIAGRVEWLHDDLTVWAPPAGGYDLVSAQYLHLAGALRRPVHRRLAAAVAPGGTLLLVGHHPSDLTTTVPRPRDPDVYFTGDEPAAALDPATWTVVTDDARPHEVTDPDGRAVTVHDTVFQARRRPADA
jgi:SAM-dependent methyltransferase